MKNFVENALKNSLQNLKNSLQNWAKNQMLKWARRGGGGYLEKRVYNG
ncbi:MAG: hypothetical protein LBE12_10840 [Planctomycetaceae bacterium]|nr:hypothetical protein [Planctomycetaceae bacterium]